MAKLSSKLEKSIKALDEAATMLKKSQPLTYTTLGNSNFILWWLTYDEALKVTNAYDRGAIDLPTYLSDFLRRMVTVPAPEFNLEIHLHPTYPNDGSLSRRDVIPHNLPMDAEDFPDAIMLPYEYLATVEPLAGVVTDLSGSLNLNFLHRVNDGTDHIPLINHNDFLIWWLTDKEAYHIIESVMNGGHDKVPYPLTSCISEIAHSFIGGFVIIPEYLTTSPYRVCGERLDEIDPQAPGEENMRDGILILASDLENIHFATGVFTSIDGETLIDKPHLPAVKVRNDDKFCIWWLTGDEIGILNDGIREGTVKLPGYLIKAVKSMESNQQLGMVIIPLHVDLDLDRLPEVIPGENEEVTGIVIPREDLNCVNRYCGKLTSVELRHVHVEDNFNQTPYTVEEIRSMFITHLTDTIRYWVGQHPNEPEEAAKGAVFSTLAVLDGCAMTLPGFAMIPMVTENDNYYSSVTGHRPWPVLPDGAMDNLVDIGGDLHSQLFRDQPRVIHCKNHLSRIEWDAGIAKGQWAHVCEVVLRKTQFIIDRFHDRHAGMVLSEAWRDLCLICLKNNALFVQEDIFYTDEDYVFRFATDDGVVFDKMIADLSGYMLRVSI